MSGHDWLPVLGVGFTLVAATAAWFSAVASRRCAIETQRASQALLLGSLLDAYSSPEMLDAMMKLRVWTTRYGDQSSDEFREQRRKDFESVQGIDHARRRVSHHFQKIRTLREARLLDERMVRIVASKEQAAFFLEVIEPLEAAIGADYDRSSFVYFAKLYGMSRSLQPMANPR